MKKMKKTMKRVRKKLPQLIITRIFWCTEAKMPKEEEEKRKN